MENEGKIKTFQSHKLIKLATNRLSMKEILKDELQTESSIIKEAVRETRKTLQLNENRSKRVTLGRTFVTLNTLEKKKRWKLIS